LVNEPQIVLADEPTGNLDQDLAREIIGLFREANERGATVIIATHDRHLLESTDKRIITLADGQLHSDTPEPRAAPSRAMRWAGRP
jgi:cell division transport system ATP-binding protein